MSNITYLRLFRLPGRTLWLRQSAERGSSDVERRGTKVPQTPKYPWNPRHDAFPAAGLVREGGPYSKCRFCST